MNHPFPPRPLPHPPEDDSGWAARSARLFTELRGPATAMVRRAFGRTFDQHAVEDIYASAWVGTLRALERRHSGLGDEEIRRYVLTAVARQASKELRRRQRRPTSPLENAEAVGDDRSGPDEHADRSEQSRITRDLLASLPRRRRAVLMLRYGWGLDPAQVCELIDGLSPRAYRKEITRGLDQLAERIRTLEKGEWCADREPILKAFAAGVADPDQRRQAERHLAHCRHCSELVSRLSGQAHELGGAIAASGGFDVVADGRVSLPGRVHDLAERASDPIGGLVARGGWDPSEAAAAIGPVAGRGAAPVAAGLTAKLAGLGAAGKAALACVGGGAAAALCVAAGFVGPLGLDGDAGRDAGLDAPRVGKGVGGPSLLATTARSSVGAGDTRAGHRAGANRLEAPSVADASLRPPEAGRTRVEAQEAGGPTGPTVVAQHVKRNYWTRWHGGPPDTGEGEPTHSTPPGEQTDATPSADPQATDEPYPTGESGPAVQDSAHTTADP